MILDTATMGCLLWQEIVYNLKMKSKSTVKTFEEYLMILDNDSAKEISELDSLIRSVIPEYKPFMMNGFVGYGHYHYKYASGREGDWFFIGLAKQKNYISIYVCVAKDNGKYVAEEYADVLGKVSVGKSCIRFKSLEDVDLKVLRKVISEGVKAAKSQYNVT